MFLVYKNCNLACCGQRRYRGFSTRLLHRSNPCRLENVPQSCSMLMHLWTCLKGEKVMMCWFSTIYLDAHSQHAYLHLCLRPSLSKSKRSWALWNRTAWVHLPTCIRGAQSSNSWMLHSPDIPAMCLHKSENVGMANAFPVSCH